MSFLPNALTIARIALVPLFAVAYFWPGEISRWIAFGLFCMAGITDLFDGMIARKLDAESSFGRMLDPIADKLIVSAALLMMAADRMMFGWQFLVPALIILCREILVSGLREFLATADVSLPVTRIAKWKTTVQVVAIATLIGCSATESQFPGITGTALIGLWIAAALTFYTGYAYVRAGLVHTRDSFPRKRSEGTA